MPRGASSTLDYAHVASISLPKLGLSYIHIRCVTYFAFITLSCEAQKATESLKYDKHD